MHLVDKNAISGVKFKKKYEKDINNMCPCNNGNAKRTNRRNN